MSNSTSYKNAPLIELIVELRWTVTTLFSPDAPPPIAENSATFDIWFNAFSSKLEKLGYLNLERLLPYDFPPSAYQPIFRYRKSRETPFPVVQFGHGIFTINAGPPDYVSWKKFRPEVEAGIKALLDAKPGENSPKKFISANVRYIDGFRDTLKEGLSNYKFIKEGLQTSIHLPKSILNLAESEDSIAPTILMRFPSKANINSLLTIQIAAGKVNNESATLMEMSYHTNEEILMETTEVLEVLDVSHGTLHSVFEMITQPIHDRMLPSRDEERADVF